MPLLKKGSTKVLINTHWYEIFLLGFTKVRNRVAAVSHHAEGSLQESIVFSVLPNAHLSNDVVLLHVLDGCGGGHT